ncbi:unnamed protein product [Calicophoron daubneyi]|uniref:Phosphatidic acid phosphatase type 2/haloperoxidase domain-containing protein n=1 Tax=Calicophoron daubneyi TaxID=300641 RepID=A0AAV2THB2_CALDB
MKKSVIAAVRVVTDLIAFVAAFIAMGVLQRIKPFRQGYFANDESIQYPFKSSTVPSYVLYIVSSILIVVTIVAVELTVYRKQLKVKKCRIPVVLYSIYNQLIVAFFGYFVTIAITDIGKVVIGRLRPNFFSVCKPTPLVVSPLNYTLEYACQSGTAKDHTDIEKSFFSGHSSTSIYSAVFLCLYIQLRLPRLSVPALRIVLQVVYISLGVTVCITRIVDNKHHWSDVLTGGIAGFLIALSVPFYIPHLYRKSTEEPTLPMFQDMKPEESSSLSPGSFSQNYAARNQSNITETARD